MELPGPNGSWFGIAEKESKSFKLNYNDFKRLAEAQIRQQLGIDETTQRATNTRGFYLEELAMTIEPSAFESFTEIANNSKEKFYPSLSFHSTQDMTKLRGIMKYGYLTPGDQHPTQGWSLRMSNGHLYGDGVYTTPQFSLTEWYSFLDYNECVQVIINLQVIGSTKVVEANKWLPDKKTPKDLRLVIPTRCADGTYVDMDGANYDFLRSLNMKVWVTGSTSRIIPIAVARLRLNNKTGIYNIPEIRSQWKDRIVKDCYIPMYHICENYYVISTAVHDHDGILLRNGLLPLRSVNSNAFKHHHIYCVSSSTAASPLLLRTIDDFVHSSDCASKHIMLYHDQHVVKHSLTADNQLVSFAASFVGRVNSHMSAASNREICPVIHRSIDLITSDSDEHTLHTVYMFVDCNHGISDYSQLQSLIDGQIGYLKVKHVIVKFIFINDTGKPVDASAIDCCFEFKSRVQNHHLFERAFHECTSNSLSDAVDVLLDESANVKFQECIGLSMPYPLGITGEGFINGFDGPPVWDGITSCDVILYKGCLPKALNIRSTQHTQSTLAVRFVEVMDADMKTKFAELLIASLARFRNYVLRNPERCRSHCSHVTSLCSSLLEMIHKEDRTWLASTKTTLKYQALKLLSDISAFGKLSLEGKWFEVFSKLKFAKSISKRVKHVVQLEDAVNAVNSECNGSTLRWVKGLLPTANGEPDNTYPSQYITVNEPLDVLPYSARLGTYIRVVTSEASEIDPWLVIVEYVSPMSGTVGEAYEKSQRDTKMYDSYGRRITDLLLHDNGEVVDRRVGDPVMKLYYGYVFTGVPYLYIDTQPIALLVSSWVCAIEKAFRCVFDEFIPPHNPHNRSEVLRLLDFAASLVPRIVGSVREGSPLYTEWSALCNDIISNEAIEKFVTTSFGITSLNKILAMLLLPCADPFFMDPSHEAKLSRLCTAMLAECVMRSCKAKLRGMKCDGETLIMHLLDLSVDTKLDEWKLDMKRAISISNRLIFHPYTNCSPFAVVSVLEFVNCIRHGKSVEEIAELFSNKQISMKSFLEQHLSGHKPKLTQVALYLQGMKYAQASERQLLPMFNPVSVKESIEGSAIDLIRRQQLIKQSRLAASSQRYAHMLMKAEEFASFHRFPKLFTEDEVAQLNRCITDPSQMYVRMNNGLLMHHCCYPECPQYLENMMSKKDKENFVTKGKHTRHGLMKHLSRDVFVGNYVPDFHNMCKRFAHKEPNFDSFCEQMTLHYKKNKHWSSIRNLEGHLRQAWEGYHISTTNK